jgi:class 3 adenylate cyclase/tetratricopeptide (TPR) repeat protein
VATELWEGVMEDLLNPVGQRSKHFNDQLWKELGIRGSENPDTEFAFQHDRIQQAAYSLIPEAEKKKTHLQIGRLLLKKLSADEVAEKVFDVIGHFNFSSELITDRSERIQIAKLNFMAGNRARNSNSYQPAVSYFRDGMKVVTHEDDAALFNDFLIARSECEYLCGNYEEAEKMFDVAIGNATSNLEKAEVLSRKMQLYENTSRQLDAIKIALEGLKLLGITLPEKPAQARILVELLKAKFALRGKSIERLKNNTDLKSPDLILAMKILVNLWGPGYLYNQNLLVLGILRMVILSARYGNSPESALAYAFYGFVLSAQLQDFTQGNEFGKLGMWLNEKFNDKVLRSKVYVIYAGCIAHWKADLSEVIDTLGKAHTVGIESNDLIYAGYATNFLSRTHYMMGDPLDTVYEKCRSYVHFGRQIQNRTVYYHLLTQTRMVTRLLGKSPEETVFMDSMDVAVAEKQMIDFAEKNRISLPLTWHYYFETEWYYRMEEYEKALEMHAKTKKIISALLGFPEIEFLKFYHSMMLMAVHRNKPRHSLRKLLRIIKSNQKILKKAGKHSPEIFLAKYLLVTAECADLNNQVNSAAKLFAEAKEAAQKSGITQDIALVNERAAEFYRRHNINDLSITLYREAIYHYRQWGAVAKVQQLEKKLDGLGLAVFDNQNTTPQPLFKPASGEATSSSLDLQSIFKASTTISGEVVFEKLLQKLMKIVLENAGAESGSLVLIQHGQLVVAAHGDTKSENIKLLNEIPIDKASFLSHAIVQFVYHTLETIILADSAKDTRFAKDNYLVRNNPKSVLCQPVIQHGKCVAIIYLENNLASGAFTPARIEVLNLLSGQIAVSIENAKLYNRQRELSDAYQRFVPHDFISALGRQSILEVKLGDSISQEMTVMFCDIRSYTTLAEGMSVADNFSFINSYHNLVGPIIKKHHGFINHYLGDGFVALFIESPEDAMNAALEILTQLKFFNEAHEKTGERPIALGIGMHTGMVMMGIIGDQERHDAGVISDVVNSASRLEGLTRHFGSNIIISDSTKNRIRNPDDFQFRHLGRIKVKGKEQVISVDEVINTDEADLRDKKVQTLALFNAGLGDYFEKRFAEAAVSFRKVVDFNPLDMAAKHYLQNAAKYMVSGVPEDWDGTEHMSEK